MDVTGTLVNYYIHCRRQCYLHGNKLNLEDNSEAVKVGKALHEAKAAQDNTELEVEHIKVDKLTKEYLVEVKKSDADVTAAKWQLLYYLYTLKQKGLVRKGRLEVLEKNREAGKQEVILLDAESERRLEEILEEIQILLASETIPESLKKSTCKKCAYFEYCYI